MTGYLCERGFTRALCAGGGIGLITSNDVV